MSRMGMGSSRSSSAASCHIDSCSRRARASAVASVWERRGESGRGGGELVGEEEEEIDEVQRSSGCFGGSGGVVGEGNISNV